MRLSGQGTLNSGLIFIPWDETTSIWRHLSFNRKKQLCVNKMPLCANITISLCITIRDSAMKSFYIDVNHLSCRAALSKTQSQGMWPFLRLVVRRRSSSPSCQWTLEITDFLTEVTAPWAQSFFQIQMKFHSTRESHFCDLLALSMLNI